jgi:hypothetical protein
MSKPRHWQALQQTELHSGYAPEAVAFARQQWNCDEPEARKRLAEYDAQCTIWINDLYQVQARKCGEDRDGFHWVHLNIRRRDGNIIRDWRHIQEIKNQLIGEECEAVEIYPAESRKVDTSNKFHLWCCTNPTFRFPFGFDQRDVDYENNSTRPGLKQRPL